MLSILGLAPFWVLYLGTVLVFAGSLVVVGDRILQNTRYGIRLSHGNRRGLGTVIMLIGLSITVTGIDSMASSPNIFNITTTSTSGCIDLPNIPCINNGNSGACTPQNIGKGACPVPTGGGSSLPRCTDNPNLICLNGGNSGVLHAIVFFISGSLSVSTKAGNINLYSPFNMNCTEVYAAVNTAPTGSSIKINVLFGGTSIFVTSPELTIPAGQQTASVTLTGSDVIILPKNLDVTINIDQIGSIIPGSDLVVQVRCYQ